MSERQTDETIAQWLVSEADMHEGTQDGRAWNFYLAARMIGWLQERVAELEAVKR
jgi:hypothetical protein